jgi:hypothetical protein
LPYPKAAAGGLLARTDFGSIIQQLPDTVKLMVVENSTGWNDLLLGVVNQFVRPAATLDSRVLPTDFSTEGIAEVELTLGEWFAGLNRLFPTDLLTKKNLPKKYGSDQADSLESLGAFGEKMDPGQGEKQRPIFEFRGLTEVPVADLPAAGLGIWDYVAEAHTES